jgi:hypothetical protein
MADQRNPQPTGLELAALAATIFDDLARQFPICMASDEFHYFPQALSRGGDGNGWDDFSPEGLAGATARLQRWEMALSQGALGAPLANQVVDHAMLLRVIRTLREQITLARVHETQPTYYLTIVGIGLAEALESGPGTLQIRIAHLPEFLAQARENLRQVPLLFRDLGIEMLAKQREWLHTLPMPESSRCSADKAFDALSHHLKHVPVQEEFRPSQNLYERIAAYHMGCLLPADEIVRELEREIAETQALLENEAAAIAPGRSWQQVVQQLPRPAGNAMEVYGGIIAELGRHCVAQGLITPDFLEGCPVKVAVIPDFMRPVRSNAAFSMRPSYPPRGGTFFIQKAGEDARVPADSRLLSAHETLPGHHLLDTCRWRQENPVRRHIEFPIFYEGWASFAEELLFETGFFSGPTDRLLMAKRRFWRAMRGQADFNLHMRRQSPEEAAAGLIAQGMPRHRAMAMVRRYALKPGYQLAYTIGRRRFRRLYSAFGREDGGAAAFVRQVLAQGEIGFDHLEQVLRQGG